MEWISVKDRLPENKGFYLVVVDEFFLSKHRGVVEVSECYQTVDLTASKIILKFHDYITHWMPLPEPPKP